MQSPFKFLDSFTKEDKDIFFGREQETEELYHKVFESKILLVYGISGTGKSSLIQCGLGNKFNESDWLPISIRRGGNINESLSKAVNSKQLSVSSNQSIEDSKQLSVNSNQSSVSGNQSATSNDKPQTTNDKQLKRSLRSLYLDHFKPIYLIFDQFEELFIFGSQPEKEEFIQTVKKISESDLNVKFLFVIREEYLANITEFEKLIPEFLENRIRIEKMQRKNAVQCIEEPCRVYGIEVEKGFSELLLDKLSPNSNEIELTYLQVFLDKIFRSITQSPTLSLSHPLAFPISILSHLGDVRDLLGSFLEEQIASLDEPDSALAILKSFVSIKGTKRQINETEINEHCKTIGFNLNYETYKKQILHFVNIRILRDKDENNRYELRHDALAAKIYEKITLVEKELMEVRQFIENAYDNYQKRGVLLTIQDLNYIAPYENKIILNDNIQNFIFKSKLEIGKAKKRRQLIFSIIGILLLTVFAGFTWWAMNERSKAIQEKERTINAIKEAETAKQEADSLRKIKAKPMVVVSATKMNVLYVGVDNPIDISISNLMDFQILAEISQGNITKTEDNSFIVNVNKPGQAIINVKAKLNDGQVKSFGQMHFRVKRVPNPIVKLAGRVSNEINRNLLLVQSGIVADLENFDFDVKFKVSRFKVATIINGFNKVESSSSPIFTSAQKELMKRIEIKTNPYIYIYKMSLL